MANYTGVEVEPYTVRGVEYLRLWWYTGQGSERRSKSIGAASKLTKAQIAHARKQQEAELAKRPEAIRAGEAPTLEAWWPKYEALRGPNVNPRTIYHLKKTHDLMVEFWGEKKKLDRITKTDVAEWRAWLAGRLTGRTDGKPSEATIALHIRQGSGLFGMHSGAAKHFPSVRNPFEGERMNASTETKGHPQLSKDDLAALVQAAPTKPGRCVIALCAWAGLRLGEALRLQWSDIAWEKNRLTATATKNTGTGKGKKREVLMVPELERVLLDAHEDAANFAAPCVGMSGHDAYEAMDAAWAASGVEEWDEPFQALRRWRDSTWKAEGYPEYVVDAWLGHSFVVSRKHYLKPPENMYSGNPKASAGDPSGILRDLTEAELDQVRAFVADLTKRRNIGATETGSTT